MRPGQSPEDSPSLYVTSTTVTPGYKLPFSLQTRAMKQWGPKGGKEMGAKFCF